MDIKDLISYADAAKILGVSRPTIYNWVIKYKLNPVSVGSNHYLLKSEVEKLKEGKHGTGK